jgi:hypothetical protein
LYKISRDKAGKNEKYTIAHKISKRVKAEILQAGKKVRFEILKLVLQDLLSQEKNGTQLIDGLMSVVVNKALKGDLKAVDMLLSYSYGKATQRTEITGAEGEKIDFTINVVQGKENLPYKPD